MRIVAGQYKGLVLKSPKGEGTRPVTNRVKESLFNILGPLDGESVLDLFAGSGALGIEALSRGANRAVFVEKNRAAADLIAENLSRLKPPASAQVLAMPALSACRVLQKRGASFDLIFCDPPYDQNAVNPTLDDAIFISLCAPNALLLVEHSPREHPNSKHWQTRDVREYGQTVVSFLRKIQTGGFETRPYVG